MMRTFIARFALAGVALLGAAVAIGCTQVVTETAKKAFEDRSTDDQVTDTKIGAGILSRLADKDKNLLLDVNVDVWEQRVMLTGTLDDPTVKQDVVKLVESDRRVRKIHDELQIVTKAEQAQRREAAKNKDDSKKEGVGQAVNDFWIETKINAKLISTRGVTSVNYRWRSVRNVVYLIGRARSEGELTTVLGVILGTEGVTKAKHFVEIKPAPK